MSGTSQARSVVVAALDARRVPRDGDADALALESERRFLGACILDPSLVMNSGVATKDFHSEAHALIFHELLDLLAEHAPVDSWALRNKLHESGKLEAVGGQDYVVALTNDGDTLLVDEHGQRVRLLARQRQVRHAASALRNYVGSEGYGRAAEQLQVAQAELATLERPNASAINWLETRQILAPLEPTRWVVPQLLIGPGRPVLFAGFGGSAKTLALQDVALAVASGTRVWDRFDTVAGEVRHLDYEQGRHATARRYQRLALGRDLDAARLRDRLKLAVFPSVFLDSPNAVDAYCRACEGASLVILDALRGATPSSDENDSSIRTCLDNLSRVSEKTGATPVVIHHAGKPKDSHSDPRTIARGSSAIFDACGAVFVIIASRAPSPSRRVVQVKVPAEAEGSAVPDAQLEVQDVEIDGNPTAGVRVVWQPSSTEAESPTAVADAKFEADASRLTDVVRGNQGASQNVIIEKSGMNRTRASRVLRALEEQGRVQVFAGERGAKTYRARAQ